MNIGLGQIDIVWEDKDKNMVQCAKMIEEAKTKGIDFLLFPEMTLTGFSMNTQTLGETLDNAPTLVFFKEMAKKYAIAICFGMIIRNGDKSENHCMIVDETGELVADYAKIHPFSYGAESDHYTGGDSLAFCTIKDVPISPLVCYDLRFPEVFQACSAKSNVITVIANWPTQRRCHWIALLKARAIENQCFIIGVNRAGTGDGLNYTGDSMVVSPYGEILVHAPEGPGLTVAICDEAMALKYREEFPLKADRKPALYTRFYTETK